MADPEQHKRYGWCDLLLKIIAVCGVIVGSLVLAAIVAMIVAWIGWMYNWWGWFATPGAPRS